MDLSATENIDLSCTAIEEEEYTQARLAASVDACSLPAPHPGFDGSVAVGQPGTSNENAPIDTTETTVFKATAGGKDPLTASKKSIYAPIVDTPAAPISAKSPPPILGIPIKEFIEQSFPRSSVAAANGHARPDGIP